MSPTPNPHPTGRPLPHTLVINTVTDANVQGPPLTLPHRQAELWLTDVAQLWPEKDALKDVLDADELKRVERISLEPHRTQFALFRGALRHVLARYLDKTPPAALGFGYGAHGKPELKPPASLQFNISHAGTRLALAISHERIGVDIEQTNRANDSDAVAARFYHPAEVARMKEQATEQRRELFYRWWTAKEAALKAWGVGLGSDQDYPDFSTWAEGPLAGIESASWNRSGLVRAFPGQPGWAGAIVLSPAIERLVVRDGSGWWAAD